MTKVRVRMAPSPTGLFHIGSARTTLFNYLFARKHGGTFVLRIEDTDRERSKKEYEQDIVSCIHWLGLDWDEGPDKDGDYGPYYQSQRLELYSKYAEQLLFEGKAYYCYCTPEELAEEREQLRQEKKPPKYSGRCRHLSDEQKAQFESEGRSKVLRFAVPGSHGFKPVATSVTFHDLIKDDITVDTKIYGDWVIMKADGMPTYNFACVVDDHLMEMTHVIRGEDHISNTPKQILIYEALGWKLPEFGHIPLILNKDRSKMSKRSGPTSVTAYREKGYLPVALDNFLALLGWSPGTDEEFFDLSALAEAFSLEHVQSSPAVFNMDKLLWFNGKYIRDMPLIELQKRVTPYLEEYLALYKDADPQEYLARILPLVSERLTKLSEIGELTDFFFLDSLTHERELLLPKKRTAEEAKQALDLTRTELESITDWTTQSIEDVLRACVEKAGWKVGELFMMIRIAVTGKKASPPLFETMAVLGKEKVLARILEAASTF